MTIENKANMSLGVLEALITISEDLQALNDDINNALQKETLKNITNKLDIIIKLLDNTSQPIVIESNVHLSEFNSIVYKLGIHQEVLRLRDLGKPVSEIANIMGLSASAITRFLKYYDYISHADKLKIRSNSVMNTPERLEELFNMILRRLHMLEGQNDELHVQYIKEMRQTLALANQVSEKMVNYKEYQKFTQNVWELLKSELPEKRSMIVQKIAYLQQQGHGGLDQVLAPSKI